MSKFDEALSTYQSELKNLGISLDTGLLTAVSKGLGPSIYNVDSSKVSSTDPKEVDRIKQNFLVKKLGLKDGPELDSAIKEVTDQLGASNRNKYRAVFYALLVKKFNKEGVYK